MLGPTIQLALRIAIVWAAAIPMAVAVYALFQPSSL
jgi:hypothetical protein